MLIAVLLIASVDPHTSLLLTGLLAFSIALLSATQDIAVDAFRIDQFTPEEQDRMPPAAAMSIIGWWTGYSWPGYIAFTQADNIGWNQVYYLMAGVLLVLILFTLDSERQEAASAAAGSRVSQALAEARDAESYNFV